MCVHSAIKVKWDSTVGRHVVADRDIAPGEVVFLESPIGKRGIFSWKSAAHRITLTDVHS